MLRETERLEAVADLGNGLYRLGGSIELDGRVTWYDAALRGYAASNSYLIRSDESALLIDPGLAVNESVLLDQLDAALVEVDHLAMVTTRAVEFECITNCAPVLSRYRVERAFSRQPLHQFVGFWPRYAPTSEDSNTSWPTEAGIEWTRMAPGDKIDVDPTGKRSRLVEVLATPVRLLTTVWLYDEVSRTLFTSDSFGHVVRPARSAEGVLREGDDDRTGLDAVRNHLLAKFDWLARADTSPLVHGVREIFAGRAVDVIAPTHGCVIAGKDAVERHLALYLEALEVVGVQESA